MSSVRIIFFILLFTARLAYSQDSTVVHSWYEKGLSYQNSGNYKDAAEWYTKVIDAGGYELAWYNRATCLIQLGEYEKGVEDYRQQTVFTPGFAKGWARYGLSIFLYSDTTKGIDEIRQATRLDSLSYFAWLAGGLYFGNNNQKDSMVSWNEKGLNLLTDSTDMDEFFGYYKEDWVQQSEILAPETKRIQKDYENIYAAYIPANNSYILIFYYAAQNDSRKVISSVVDMFETEKVLPKPRNSRTYYAFNYFNYLGIFCFKGGDYNYGKLCLDYLMDIASVIKENTAWAKAWANQGFKYYYEVKYDSCLWAYRKAEQFYGKEPFDSTISVVYSTMGLVYMAYAQFDSAEILIKKSIRVCSRKDLSTYSICLNNLGMFCQKTGDYELANKYYMEALELAIGARDTAFITIFYNNLGNICQSTAAFDSAEYYFLKALALNRDNHPNLATIFSNLAYLHIMWGNFPTAKDYCLKALKEALENKLADRVWIVYNNLSLCYRGAGDYSMALKALRESISISQQLGLEENIALGYNNLALLFSEIHRYDSVSFYLHKAMDLNVKLHKETELGMNFDNIGTLMLKTKEYDSAIYYINLAIEYDTRFKRRDRLVSHYSNLATAYLEKEDYENSEKYFIITVGMLEEIRKTAKGAVRREYLEQVIINYRILALVQTYRKNYEDAFATLELGKAKLLGEQLAGSGQFKSTTLKQVQESIDDSTGIYFFNSMFSNEGIGMLIDKKGIRPISFKTDSLLHNFNRLVPSAGGDIGVDSILTFYRDLLLIPGLPSRGSVFVDSIPGVSPEMREKVSKLLYSYYFDDIDKDLVKYKRLIMVPDGMLNFLPFESLLDSNGKYLVEKTDIGYIQSMSIEQVISKRKYPAQRKPMLAFGGAVYETGTGTPAAVAKAKTDEAKKAVAANAKQAIASRGHLNDAYSKLGYGNWQNLPGTLAEVENLKRSIPGCETFEGSDVNERKVKYLSEKNALASYKVIHFATHGLVVPEVPDLSALVLSQSPADTAEDNYLRADEISNLKLNADFVALSACETGLGKLYKGDGVVGLTQSFMIAGANSLAVSLWQVNDESTSKFMTGIYTTVSSSNDYLHAMSVMKRSFISGIYGDAYKAPYYWAPFIYYGKFGR
jgi:CHAT domain-containing protein/tetratricopeptide (TPR) repeat protein